jgi:D-serine dehydratase
MLEIGVDGRAHRLPHAGRCHGAGRAPARQPGLPLVGIETYEGQGATGASEPDKAYADTLMDRVRHRPALRPASCSTPTRC